MNETDRSATEDMSTADEEGVIAGGATPEDDAGKLQSFEREHVQKLRDEAASHRVRAERADALAARLATAQAALTGKLADATDLPCTADLLDDDGLVDEAELQAAVDDLVQRERHVSARRPTGDVRQGARLHPVVTAVGDQVQAENRTSRARRRGRPRARPC